MLKIQNLSQLNLVIDTDMLNLLRLRFNQLNLDINVSMFIDETGDTVEDIEKEIEFLILTNLFDDSRFPDPDFVPCFEVLEDHGNFYEILFLFSDGDDGTVEIFIPKTGDDPLLLSMCSQFAVVLN